MIELEHLSSLKEYLQTAETAAVIVGPRPTADQVAVASALYLGLASLGKDVGLYAPRKLSYAFPTLKNLRTELGKQNLVVEFDYNDTAVDKVSYHIGEHSHKFYLTVKPKKGAKPLDSSTVKFSYAGADADVVFLVGVHDLETLDQLYFGYENLYEHAFVTTFHTFKPEIGNVQFDLSGRSSMSESAVAILEGLDMPLTAEMATDLLIGIESMTQNLRSLTATAETFEVVAKLLHTGARRAKSTNEQARPTIQPAQKPTHPVARKQNTRQVHRPKHKPRRKLIIKR